MAVSSGKAPQKDRSGSCPTEQRDKISGLAGEAGTPRLQAPLALSVPGAVWYARVGGEEGACLSCSQKREGRKGY